MIIVWMSFRGIGGSWFDTHELEIELDATDKDLETMLNEIPGLESLLQKYVPGVGPKEAFVYMEFLLHGIAEYSLISKNVMQSSISFSDILSTIFSSEEEE